MPGLGCGAGSALEALSADTSCIAKSWLQPLAFKERCPNRIKKKIIIMVFYPFLPSSFPPVLDLRGGTGLPPSAPCAWAGCCSQGRLGLGQGGRLSAQSPHKYQIKPVGRDLGWE